MQNEKTVDLKFYQRILSTAQSESPKKPVPNPRLRSTHKIRVLPHRMK